MQKVRKRHSYHHGDLRRALVAAALEAVAQDGPEGFTLRDLARRVGVAPSAPYRHFADKDALLAAVAADCSERLGAAMDAAAAQAGDDPLQRFRLCGIAYVRFAVEHPAHFRAMNLPGVAQHGPLTGDVAAWMEQEVAHLARAQQAGLIADLPIPQIMLAARALTYGLARLIVDAQEGLGNVGPEQAAELAVGVTEVLGLGLVPRPKAEETPARKARRRPAQ